MEDSFLFPELAEVPPSVVYIPQEPKRRDPDTQEMVSVVDLNGLQLYGTPRVLLPTGPVALNTAPTIWSLKDKLRGFSDNDFLVCVGDPTLFAMAAIIASEINRGKVRFLRWDRVMKAHIEIKFDLFHKLGKED